MARGSFQSFLLLLSCRLRQPTNALIRFRPSFLLPSPFSTSGPLPLSTNANPLRPSSLNGNRRWTAIIRGSVVATITAFITPPRDLLSTGGDILTHAASQDESGGSFPEAKGKGSSLVECIRSALRETLDPAPEAVAAMSIVLSLLHARCRAPFPFLVPTTPP